MIHVLAVTTGRWIFHLHVDTVYPVICPIKYFDEFHVLFFIMYHLMSV